MKKLLIFALAFSVICSVVAFAQNITPVSGQSGNSAGPPLMTIQGTVKSDNGKITFVADKDMKSWDVINQDALKGHEGHHVEISAHVYADKGQVHIMSVKMLGKSSM